jgi:hypothetical protein
MMTEEIKRKQAHVQKVPSSNIYKGKKYLYHQNTTEVLTYWYTL